MKDLCPNEENMADYIEGHLSTVSRQEMETHFSVCDRCMEELITVGSLLSNEGEFDVIPVSERTVHNAECLVKELTPPLMDYMLKQAGWTVKSIVSGIKRSFDLIIGLEPKLVVIRGPKKIVSDNLVRLSRTFKAVEVGIEFEKINKGDVHIRVRKKDKNGPEKTIRVTLNRNEKDLYSYLIDDKEEVLFEYVPYGHYALIFSQSGKKIGMFPFEIKETNCGRG